MVDRRRKKLINEGGEKRYMIVKNNEKGITLIALIISIIILVILAAVSIRAVYNMGIVGHAINGTQQYAQRAVEENQMMAETTSKIDEAVARVKEIQNGSSGNNSGETGGNNNSGNEQNTEAPDLLKDYVLGAADAETGLRPGKDEEDIFDYDSKAFKNDTLGITYLNEMGNTDSYNIYIRYDNVAYKIVEDPESHKTTDVVGVYTPEANSKVGRVVQYSVDGTSAARDWIVLYDNGSTIDITPVDITQADVEKENKPWTYTLGYNDPAAIEALPSGTNLERAQNSYENAVTRLNTYCGTLVTNSSVYTEGTGANAVRYVRSIGTRFGIAETTTRYSSTFLLNNPDTEEKGNYNGVGLIGDMNGEQDVVRMSYYSAGGTGSGYTTYGYALATNNYWLASRFVNEVSGFVGFGVRYVNGGGASNCYLWYVVASGAFNGYNTFAVRPVVRVAVESVSGL